VETVVNPGGELGLDTLDGLVSLVESNLVRSVEAADDEPRFTMLETIREYGLERLAEAGGEAAIRRRHAEHWTQVAERVLEALSGPDQAAWTRRLERDHDNFRSALSWMVSSGEAELGLRLGAALGDFWRLGSHVREGVRWLGSLLALPGAAGSTLVRARALHAAGELLAWINKPEDYLRFSQEAVAIYRDLGDSRGMAAALQELGWAELELGHLDGARTQLAEARRLSIGLGDRQKAGECSNRRRSYMRCNTKPDGSMRAWGQVGGKGSCSHHGRSLVSILVIHLTHQKPRRPGATMRAG
jgi:hypothetical protein